MLHPLSGYLLLRGLSTLPVRVTAAGATAAELARRLEAHPAVARVYYPGLTAGRPERQMQGGGAILAFEPVGDPHALIGAVRLITPAVSLGSIDTLIQHPGSISHRIVAPEDRASAGISEQLLRVSVGLEDVEDLWDDLERALKGI
jgi:methionine-gamma-lyase